MGARHGAEEQQKFILRHSNWLPALLQTETDISVICNSGGQRAELGEAGPGYQGRWQVTITVQITGTLVLIIPRNVEC